MCIDSKLDLSYFKLVLGHVREVNGVELFRKIFVATWTYWLGIVVFKRAPICLLLMQGKFYACLAYLIDQIDMADSHWIVQTI